MRQPLAARRGTERALLLMCRPEHFAVSYAINPWMDPPSWARDRARPCRGGGEWQALHGTLAAARRADRACPAGAGLPDLVFTANAAVVLDRQVLLARFRHPERRREEPHFAAAFRSLQARGLVDDIKRLPESLVLEGAGDCVFDARGLFWLGYGPRSDAAARAAVRTCLATKSSRSSSRTGASITWTPRSRPLPGGEVMYCPAAFTAAGRAAIRRRVARARSASRLGIADGCRLAANAVCIGRNLVMSACSARLRGTAGGARLPRRDDAAAVVPAQRRRGVLPDAAARPPVGSRLLPAPTPRLPR